MTRALRHLRAHEHLTAPAERPTPGTYLTDERRLLRVVSRRTGASEAALVEVEDCSSLDVWVIQADELSRLRRVRS
jgi:hypothetical protein